MTTQRRHFGDYGEKIVADYLIKRNFTILGTNFRIRGGEVDIIARSGNTVVFVEVKTRKNPLIDPAEVITRSKQKKIIYATQVYCAQKKLDNQNVMYRFDVALVSCSNTQHHIDYIENAFQVDDYA